VSVDVGGTGVWVDVGGIGVAVGVGVVGRTLKLSVLQLQLSYKIPDTHSHTLYSPPGLGVSRYGNGLTRSHNEVGPKVPSPLLMVTTP